MTRQKRRSPEIFFGMALAAAVFAVGLAICGFYTRDVATLRFDRNYNNTFPPSYRPTVSPSYRISFVHDGDTIYAKGVHEGIRLLGIDAPELAGSYRCGKDANCSQNTEEYGASEAKEKLKELVLNKEVLLEEDETVGATDKYNRWLRYVFICMDGSRPAPTEILSPADCQLQTVDCCFDLSLALIQSGLARESGFGKEYEKQNVYREAELQAKSKKLGIWGTCYN